MPKERTLVKIQTILAITDFSAQAEWALERAVLIAAHHRAKLRLMYFPAQPDLIASGTLERLALRGRQLARRHGVAVEAVHRDFYTLEEVMAETGRAELLVLHQRSHSTFADRLKGTMTSRVLRLCHCPVLFVKDKPGRTYSRVLVAVDFAPESRKLVQYACGISDASEIQLFHALGTAGDTRLRMADASAGMAQAYRQELRSDVQGRLFQMADSGDTRRNRVLSFIGHGDPAHQIAIQQESTGADLVVIGKARRSALADFFYGSVAQRFLGVGNGDVLVVPHEHRTSSQAAANLRFGEARARAS
jgi:nucleotide-binding universal stress UspA family protein